MHAPFSTINGKLILIFLQIFLISEKVLLELKIISDFFYL